MNIFLNSYLVDFVMNPIARFTVRIFTFFLQSTPLHGPHRIKFAPIGILLNPLKHPSVRPLLVLTLLSLCSSFGALHGQESTPWWKSLFRGTQQRESPDRQLDQTPESKSTSPFENTAPALPESAPVPNNQSSEDANRDQEVRPQGSVTFQWDSRVDELELAWKTAAHPLSGFRIQIFSRQPSTGARSAFHYSSKCAQDSRVSVSAAAELPGSNRRLPLEMGCSKRPR